MRQGRARLPVGSNLKSSIVKRLYRFALINSIGIIGLVLTLVSVWCLYFTANTDWCIPMFIGGLLTWFYAEVVNPNAK